MLQVLLVKLNGEVNDFGHNPCKAKALEMQRATTYGPWPRKNNTGRAWIITIYQNDQNQKERRSQGLLMITQTYFDPIHIFSKCMDAFLLLIYV